jgi:hypothetical protein
MESGKVEKEIYETIDPLPGSLFLAPGYLRFYYIIALKLCPV